MSAAPLVAVVDDDPRVLESIENLLQSAGFFVQTYGSAQQLLRSPDLAGVACLVSDVSMPDMDGFALQQRVAVLRPGLPVIFITGHELGAAALAQAQRGQGLLRKPFEGAALLAAVARALAGTRP
ncbi:response regulator transcription factor [Rubrivivax sp. RP6-9]|uniref:response regulator transcription factor n=1 Tax=Rubrivivax sp. RP6-9 TaxID=3415750 RepID=UPI003CC5D1DA